MKRILIIAIIFLATNQLFAQNDDTFVFRNDTTIDYKLPVLLNDTKFAGKSRKIISFVKKTNGSSFNLSISPLDSNYISITESSTIANGGFTYYTTDSSGASDSGTVYFSKQAFFADMYPGDVNGDSFINHLDIIPIGLLFNKYGSPRHNIDLSTSFVPRKVGNWFFNAGNINGKHADINGDGEINSKDITSLNSNLGLSRGTYKPQLSPVSTSAILEVDKSIPDTLNLKDTSRLIILLTLNNTNPINAYALGYTIVVKSQDKQSGQDTFYKNYSFTREKGFLSQPNDNLYLDYPQNNNQRKNIVFSKSNGTNTPIGGGSSELGVVEVVVDEILGGIFSKDDIRTIKIELSDVVFVDNTNTLIPISPVSRTLYLRKDFGASIAESNINQVTVYPNPISSQFAISKSSAKSDLISVYNSLGQIIYQTKISNPQTMISNINWNAGIYYLKVESTGQTIRLIKQ